jgi:hypothetical protein
MASIIEQHQHPKYPRLSVQLRQKSRFYQGLTFLDGRKVQKSLKTDQLLTAFKLGEDWYKKLLRASVTDGRQHPIDRLATNPTVAEIFKSYFSSLEKRKRPEASKRWGPIADFWRTEVITEVTPLTFRAFFKWRRKRLKTITPHTLHKDVVLIRQVLKHAIEEEHLTALPLIPTPGTIDANPRPWLTHAEWEHLSEVAGVRLIEAEGNKRLHQQRKDLFQFMIFMVESMLRVDELRELTVGQVRLMQEGKIKYLIIDAQGKRGHRSVIAGGQAVRIFKERREGLKPTAKLWEHKQRDGFRELLIAAKLRVDAFGRPRNLKSLRATAISFRILAGAPSPNLLLIARNAGTSVAMIDNFYAKRLSAELGATELSQSSFLQTVAMLSA